MDWKPLYDKLIVRRKPEVTEIMGMAVPDQAKEKQNIGTVVETGEGRLTATGDVVELTVQIGDEVLFNKFAGVPLEEDDPDLVVLREDEILAYRKGAV